MTLLIILLTSIFSCNRIDNLHLKIKGNEVSQEQMDKNKKLIDACNKNDTNAALILISNGADIHYMSEDGKTPYTIAESKSNYTLTEEFAMIISQDNDAFIKACSEGNLAKIQFLIDKSGINIEEIKDEKGNTPLILACEAGHLGIVELLLLNNGANINITNTNGNTPLMLACEAGHLEIVELLLNNGANINMTNDNEDTAFMLACYESSLKVVEFLVNKLTPTRQKVTNKNGYTPLMFACKKGNAQVVDLLLKKKCYTEYDQEIALKLAKKNNHTNVIKKIGGYKLLIACSNNKLAEAKKIITSTSHIDFHFKNKNGETPVIVACKKRNRKLINLLIEQIGIANLSQEEKNIALVSFCKLGKSIAIIESLLNAGANVNYRTIKNGITPLLALANRYSTEADVKQLLKWGANPFKANNKNKTPLMVVKSKSIKIELIKSESEKRKLTKSNNKIIQILEKAEREAKRKISSSNDEGLSDSKKAKRQEE